MAVISEGERTQAGALEGLIAQGLRPCLFVAAGGTSGMAVARRLRGATRVGLVGYRGREDEYPSDIVVNLIEATAWADAAPRTVAAARAVDAVPGHPDLDTNGENRRNGVGGSFHCWPSVTLGRLPA